MQGRVRLGILILLAGVAQGEDHLKFGQPACSGQVLDKTFFVLCHSGTNKIPIWVGYALTREDLATDKAGRTENFRRILICLPARGPS